MTPEESYSAFLDRVIGPLPPGEGDGAATEGTPARGLHDDFQADRVLRQMQHLQREIVADTTFYLEETARLIAWEQAQRAPRERRLAYLEGLLRDYYEHLKDVGKVYKPTRRKSHEPHVLPHGTLEASYVSIDFDIAPGQEADAVAWCKAHGLVKTTEDITWGAVRKRLRATDDGGVAFEHLPTDTKPSVHEVVPWAVITRQPHETFRVKLAGGTPAKDVEEMDGDA